MNHGEGERDHPPVHSRKKDEIIPGFGENSYVWEHPKRKTLTCDNCIIESAEGKMGCRNCFKIGRG